MNRSDVVKALVRNYPAQLRKDSIGGTTLMWVLLDDSGSVRANLVRTSSGITDLDDAASHVVGEMKFTPALLKGSPVWAWIQLPVVFCVQCPPRNK